MQACAALARKQVVPCTECVKADAVHGHMTKDTEIESGPWERLLRLHQHRASTMLSLEPGHRCSLQSKHK